jgi:transcription initiation factor TFIIIB Brf1 subunit/transcription initiation factor TFIIB
MDREYLPRPITIDEIVVGEIRKFLLDLMEHVHVPRGVLEKTVFSYQTFRDNPLLRSFNNRVIAAFALYDMLNQDNTPRTLHEICYYADIKPKAFWNIEKVLNYHNGMDPRSLVSRAVGELSIPFSFCPHIMMSIYMIERISCAKPSTILACAINIARVKYDLQISLSEISQVCAISESSIKTLYNRVKNDIH